MRFIILMSASDDEWNALTPDEQAAVVARHEAFGDALRSDDRYVDSYRFAPVAEARSVTRDREGGFSVTPGPATNPSAAMGGMYIIEAESMDEAVDWAQRVRFIAGTNEVRAVWGE